VDRKVAGERAINFPSLSELVARRHDHEDVHVATSVRSPIGVGAEENDLLRLKAIRDLARVPPNHCYRHIGAGVPALECFRGRFRLSETPLAHRSIIPRNAAESKHLAVLEEANLVVIFWRGREKLHYLNPLPIHEIAERWIGKFERGRLRVLAELKKQLEGETDG